MLLLSRGVCFGDESENATISFSREVRPILSDKCFKCHGPDQAAREGDLRLDRRQDAEKVLSPAKPKQSELLHRITSSDPDERMPQQLSDNRAMNAVSYLADERGIDRSRIGTRTGAAQPGAGAMNRRIDIVWVPEGATF